MAEPEEPIKHYWLYVLRLEDEKYYIGTTSRKDPNVRIREHLNGFYTAEWVKKYPALDTKEVIDIGNLTASAADELEDKRTLQYVEKYGYQNVRGGKFNYSGNYIKVGSQYFRDRDFYGQAALAIMTVAMLFMTVMAWR